MEAVTRAQRDIRAGRPWLARDRLLSVLRDEPGNQTVLRGLAEACTALGIFTPPGPAGS